ncbi:MAG: hypothetical protein GY854_13650 [Deltaproteobacteria bacterium]|nr:hypothetical protein [Deltaproteobacteria bacterium]
MTGHKADFESGYEKFVHFVDSYNLFPTDRNKIVIAYSGGKDASLLLDFLNEYKNRSRPDISIELITAVFPRFLYDSPDPSRRARVDSAVKYWTDKGFLHTRINAGPEFPDSILDGDNPCQQCALVIKPTLFGKHIVQSKYEGAVFSVGLTLDDAIGWFIELLLVAADRGDWKEIKKANPKLYSLAMLLSVRVSCRLQIKKNNLLYSRPMMVFNDNEIRRMVAERGLPLIPEDCKEVQGRDVFVDSPRRDIGIALEAVRRKYPADSPVGMGSIYSDYNRATGYFKKSGLLPDQEEREKFVSDGLPSIK